MVMLLNIDNVFDISKNLPQELHNIIEKRINKSILLEIIVKKDHEKKYKRVLNEMRRSINEYKRGGCGESDSKDVFITPVLNIMVLSQSQGNRRAIFESRIASIKYHLNLLVWDWETDTLVSVEELKSRQATRWAQDNFLDEIDSQLFETDSQSSEPESIQKINAKKELDDVRKEAIRQL